MTTDLIEALREADLAREIHPPTAASAHAIALRERITADHDSRERNASRPVRWIALATAGLALGVIGATLLTPDQPRQASAALAAAIDATSALTSGEMTTTITDADPVGVSTMTVRFDGPDWSVDIANADDSASQQYIASRHVDGTTYGRFGDGPWEISDGSTDKFDADRFLTEQADALASLASLQPCAGTQNSFCGDTTSIDTINAFLLVDLGADTRLQSATIRIDTADGLVRSITIHMTRADRDAGLTITETYSQTNQPQNIARPVDATA